ncbi:MAG: YdeI/OmpD-associated family protein [Sphingobacteriales bacterium]|nr:YdeI/OmpD-associated family protein [Sphingobacteriales bacterium]MBI3719755.1 YdeI/OmpD-associated family protein [Sphingobacteriales bacterium]
MKKFKATIEIIGVNPYVLLPETVLNNLFKEAGKDKGPIPVKGIIEGHAYVQTLVKYRGKWRLYINGPMIKTAKKDVGDTVNMTVEFDAAERTHTIHPKLAKALLKNKEAKKVFEKLSPYKQKEIIRYINHLKSKEAVERNIKRAISFLLEKERFIGRDKP